MLHAGTEMGDILICDTRNRVLEDKTNYPLIRKVGTRTGLPLSIGVVKGYLLAATTHELLVYNTTAMHRGDGDISMVFSYPWSDSVGQQTLSSPLTGAPYFSTTLTKVVSNLPSHLAVLTADELLILESLLPFERPKPIDLSWLRGPIIIGALIIVFLWRWGKRMLNPTGTSRGSRFGGMSRDSDLKLSKADLDQLKATMEGIKHRRTSLGSSSSPPDQQNSSSRPSGVSARDISRREQ